MKKGAFLTVMAILCTCPSGVSAQKIACVGDSITYGAGIPNRMTGSLWTGMIDDIRVYDQALFGETAEIP